MDICHGKNSLYDDRTAHKWDQADYTSYQASNLMRHLKTHSGKKSNKCNQCEYACSDPSGLRTYLKTCTEENIYNQCDYASIRQTI